MKKILMTGSTGMVGGLILQNALADKRVESISSISRNTTGITDKRLYEIIHNDFSDLRELNDTFKNIDVAYFCLGAYTGDVSDELFKLITIDYTIHFAKLLKEFSPKATFCLLSGAGADQTEKSRMSFAKYKGIAENKLIELGFPELYIFRPSYIYPVTKRKEPNAMYRISRMLYPVINKVIPKAAIRSDVLAHSMFEVGLSGFYKKILENEDIKRVIKKEV